jgi:N-methylhydantoinase A
MPIARDGAEEAVAKLARALNMTTVEAAWGILTVLSANCMTAMRTISIERGYDPREFTLVPFGGMGPTIAGRFAPELGIGRLLVPRDPGTFSAYGMLVTDVRQERSITRITALEQTTPADLDGIFSELEQTVMATLARAGTPRERLQALRSAGMRYSGQSYEVTVPVGALASPDDIAELARRFHDAHQRRYGHMAENQPIEIVNFKLTGVEIIPKPAMTPAKPGGGRMPAPAETRSAYFDPQRALDVPVFRRTTLEPGVAFEGPAIVEEKTSTTVVYPGQRVRVDEYLNLEIELPSAS